MFTILIGNVKVFRRPDSPWVEVETPKGAIAVWAETGAIHPLTECGAVADAPLVLPFPDDDFRRGGGMV